MIKHIILISFLLITNLLANLNQIDVKNNQQTEEIFKESLLPHLKEYGDCKKYLDCNEKKEMIHSLYTIFKIPTSKKEEIVFITKSTMNDYDCHSCAPKLSFFKFEKEEDIWNLTIKDIDTNIPGSWGEPSTIELVEIGKDNYAFQINFAYGGQGRYSNYKTIYIFKNNKLNPIINITIKEDNENFKGKVIDNWEATVSLIKSDKSFYDIEVEKKGIKNSQEFKIKEFYIFNKDKYILDKNK